MLYKQDLENLIFSKHQLISCDELVIISGYVGPDPVMKLQTLPIPVTVVYGMYGCDGIHQALHNSLVKAQQTIKNINIFYSLVPVHSKCYVWKNNNKIQGALIGSANFSKNGLTTPFKEVLADATIDTFLPLSQYINDILKNTVLCIQAQVKNNSLRVSPSINTSNPNICSLPLYYIKNGKKHVHDKSGLNWGKASAHVAMHDAYIPIGVNAIDAYPNLFPVKTSTPNNQAGKKNHRHNDNIEVIWDDGVVMTCVLEGNCSRNINGIKQVFPKQLCSTPRKGLLGEYLRKRMGLPSNHFITYSDLQNYGRDTIDVSLQGEGIYYCDFSV